MNKVSNRVVLLRHVPRTAPMARLPDVSKLSLHARRGAATGDFYTMPQSEALYRVYVNEVDSITQEFLMHSVPRGEPGELFRLPGFQNADQTYTYSVYDAEMLWKVIARNTPDDPIPDGWTEETYEEANRLGRAPTWTGWVNSRGDQMPLRPAPTEPTTNLPLRRSDWILLRDQFNVPDDLFAAHADRFPHLKFPEPQAMAWRADTPKDDEGMDAPLEYETAKTVDEELQHTANLRTTFKDLMERVRSQPGKLVTRAQLSMLRELDDAQRRLLVSILPQYDEAMLNALDKDIKEHLEDMEKLFGMERRQNQTIKETLLNKLYLAVQTEQMADETVAEAYTRLSVMTQERNRLQEQLQPTLPGWTDASYETSDKYVARWQNAEGEYRYYRPTADTEEWQRLVDKYRTERDDARVSESTRAVECRESTRALVDRIGLMQNDFETKLRYREARLERQQEAYDNLNARFRDQGDRYSALLKDCQDELVALGARQAGVKRALDAGEPSSGSDEDLDETLTSRRRRKGPEAPAPESPTPIPEGRVRDFVLDWEGEGEDGRPRPPAASPPFVLAPGARVVTMYGRLGTVVNYDTPSNRWHVRLDGDVPGARLDILAWARHHAGYLRNDLTVVISEPSSSEPPQPPNRSPGGDDSDSGSSVPASPLLGMDSEEDRQWLADRQGEGAAPFEDE